MNFKIAFSLGCKYWQSLWIWLIPSHEAGFNFTFLVGYPISMLEFRCTRSFLLTSSCQPEFNNSPRAESVPQARQNQRLLPMPTPLLQGSRHQPAPMRSAFVASALSKATELQHLAVHPVLAFSQPLRPQFYCSLALAATTPVFPCFVILDTSVFL